MKKQTKSWKEQKKQQRKLHGDEAAAGLRSLKIVQKKQEIHTMKYFKWKFEVQTSTNNFVIILQENLLAWVIFYMKLMILITVSDAINFRLKLCGRIPRGVRGV